jgi:hypothetical protein
VAVSIASGISYEHEWRDNKQRNVQHGRIGPYKWCKSYLKLESLRRLKSEVQVKPLSQAQLSYLLLQLLLQHVTQSYTMNMDFLVKGDDSIGSSTVGSVHPRPPYAAG